MRDLNISQEFRILRVLSLSHGLLTVGWER